MSVIEPVSNINNLKFYIYGNNQVRGIHWLHCKPFDGRDYVVGNIEKLRKFVK